MRGTLRLFRGTSDYFGVINNANYPSLVGN